MTKLKTGRHTSTIKANRKSNENYKRNIIIKNKIKNLAKKIKFFVQNKDLDSSIKLLSLFFSQCDKAVKKNILHNKTAIRKKSKLSKFINRLTISK
ncbi:MAG: 30S ribosomal protein S20 [Endomicrobium sp.]|jgi:small subunit ribosomal protein S20|nr:30S ribosomal protein S20 [Endomicrobium sp.]